MSGWWRWVRSPHGHRPRRTLTLKSCLSLLPSHRNHRDFLGTCRECGSAVAVPGCLVSPTTTRAVLSQGPCSFVCLSHPFFNVSEALNDPESSWLRKYKLSHSSKTVKYTTFMNTCQLTFSIQGLMTLNSTLSSSMPRWGRRGDPAVSTAPNLETYLLRRLSLQC